MDMYTSIMPGWQRTLIHIYFITFWIAIVLIQMNIVIAIVLEIYGSVTEQVREKYHKRSVQAQLRDIFKGDDVEQIKQKISEAKEIIEQEEARLKTILEQEGYASSDYKARQTLLSSAGAATNRLSVMSIARTGEKHHYNNRKSYHPDTTKQIIML